MFFNLFTLSFIIFENEKIIDIKKFFSFYIFFSKVMKRFTHVSFTFLIFISGNKGSQSTNLFYKVEKEAPLSNISQACSAMLSCTFDNQLARLGRGVGLEDFLALIPRLVKR